MDRRSSELVVLGSGTCVPSGRRNSSGYWIESNDVRVRFDCGAGSVHAMQRFGLDWERVSHQLVSHFHVDHFGEIPALLFALKWGRSRERQDPFHLVGPVGMKARLEGLRLAFGDDLFELGFPLEIIEVLPGQSLQLGKATTARFEKSVHTPESLAIRLTTDDLSVGYTGDTAYSEHLARFFLDVDVLIGECSFVEGTQASRHLDVDGLTNIASGAAAKHLVASHSYFDVDKELLQERLERKFPGWVTVAEDGTRVRAQRRSPVRELEPTVSHILHRNPRAVVPEVAWAEGVRIGDRRGNEYLDACGGAAVASLGYDHPVVRERIVEQLRRVPNVHSSFFTNSSAEELASLLVARSPATMDRVVFSSSGTESIEVALKLAKQYFSARGEGRRDVFIGRRHSYHGGSLGALSVGASGDRKRPFRGLLSSHHHIGPCYAYRHRHLSETLEEYGLRAAGELQECIDRMGRHRVIAFVVETVAGSTLGVVPPAPGYFREVRRICDQNDILLILDEVMCGAYRCGGFGAFEAEGIVPDIYCLAKGLGSGYQPLGATIVAREIHRTITMTDGAFLHAGTFLSHGSSCSGALAVQRWIEYEGIEQRVRSNGRYLDQLLRHHLGGTESVGDVRGRGLLYGVEFVADRETKAPLSQGEFARQVRQAAIEEGVLVYPGGGSSPEGSGDHVLLAPPFIATRPDLEEMVVRLARAVRVVERSWSKRKDQKPIPSSLSHSPPFQEGTPCPSLH